MRCDGNGRSSVPGCRCECVRCTGREALFSPAKMVERPERAGRPLSRETSTSSVSSESPRQLYLVVHFASGEVSNVSVEPTATLGSVLVRVCRKRHLDIEYHRFWAMDDALELELDKRISDIPVLEIRCAPVESKHIARRAHNYREDLFALERILNEHKRHLILLQRRHEDTYEPPSSLDNQIAHFAKVVAMMETERRRLLNLVAFADMCMARTTKRECLLSSLELPRLSRVIAYCCACPKLRLCLFCPLIAGPSLILAECADACEFDEEGMFARRDSVCSGVSSDMGDSMRSVSSSAMSDDTGASSTRVSECHEVPDVPVSAMDYTDHDADGVVRDLRGDGPARCVLVAHGRDVVNGRPTVAK
eukprot:Opistho-1_new@88032